MNLQKQYKVLKDFLTLQKGDIIEISFFGNDNLSFNVVSGRFLDVKEYIKFPNPPINGKKYIWLKKEQQPFEALTFKVPNVPKDLSQEFKDLYSQCEWVQLCKDKYIKELIVLGVFDVI